MASPTLECLLNRLFRRRSNKTSKLRITGLCEGNPSVTGGFQRASNAAMFPFHDVIMTPGTAVTTFGVALEWVTHNSSRASPRPIWSFYRPSLDCTSGSKTNFTETPCFVCLIMAVVWLSPVPLQCYLTAASRESWPRSVVIKHNTPRSREFQCQQIKIWTFPMTVILMKNPPNTIRRTCNSTV